MLLLAMAGAAHADDESFTVTDIRAEGLQRISEGTLFNSLPVNVGETLDARRVREALRTVYDTGFFHDVELRREEPGVLVVVVQERPTIRNFAVAGNKDFKTEDLTRSLRSVGLASGKILNRSTLEDVRQYLTEKYFAGGRYGVLVDARVEEVPGNLVDVRVDIVEGKRARIRQINVVGNEKFTDDELLGPLELSASNLLSFYRGDDKYSRQALEGDLEKIRSYYLDRGYAEFEITSTQVSITPEKQDLFVTVNVFEGDAWKTGVVKLAGRFTVAEKILRQYLVIKPGDVYSQKLIATSEQALRDRLGEAGYAFAEVAAVPVANAQTHEIALTFQIEPNARSYVRHIEFQGVARTNDDVLRREMRQLEGGALSNVALQRSEERLQRLPYIEKAEYETRRVPGSEDLVDVEFKVEEGPSSQISRWHRLFRTPGIHAQWQLHRQQPVRHRRATRARAQRRTVRPGIQRRALRSVFHQRWGVSFIERVLCGARAPHILVLAVHHPDLQRGPRSGLSTVRESVHQFRPHLQPRGSRHRGQQLDAVARLGAQQW